MPIYEYRCNACGEVFSRLYRSIRAAEAAESPACPTCGSAEVQRLISQIAVVGDAAAGGESAESDNSAAEPTPLFGRKELNERLRRDRNRNSIARVDD